LKRTKKERGKTVNITGSRTRSPNTSSGSSKEIGGLYLPRMKGKHNVLSEVNLVMSCYSLIRHKGIPGPKKLRNRLKMLAFEKSTIFELISGVLSHFLFPVSLIYHKGTGYKTIARVL